MPDPAAPDAGASSSSSRDRAADYRWEALAVRVERFAEDRNWGRFHDPKSLLLALVGEVGELAELFQWLPADEALDRAASQDLRPRVRDELADVLVYLVRLAQVLGVNLLDAAHDKVARDEARFAPGSRPSKPS